MRGNHLFHPPTVVPSLVDVPGLFGRVRMSTSAATLALAVGVAALGVGMSPPAAADIAQQINASQALLDQLNAKAEVAAERYNAGRIKLAHAQQAAASAAGASERANVALAAIRVQVGAFAASAYRSGANGQSLSLLTDGNPSTFLDKMSSLNRIAASQREIMTAAAAARHLQASAAAAAAAALSDAQATIKGLEQDKAQVVSAAGQAQQVLIGLQAKQAELIKAARDASARQAAIAEAAALAVQARNAAAATAAFSASPVASERPVATRRTTHYSGSAAQVAVQAAMDQLGKPYQYGAAGPDTFDCSGLTMYSYAQAGIQLPHYTGDQWNQGSHVAESDLRPGDLVFFDNLNHEGMYVGNGNFIHAPHTGDVVKISPLSGYWDSVYVGAVRLAG